MTVARDSLGDRALDLGVAPRPDPALWMRGDVGGNRPPPIGRKTLHQGSAERPAAFAETVLEIRNDPGPGGMALHAMADRHEVGAAFDRMDKRLRRDDGGSMRIEQAMSSNQR